MILTVLAVGVFIISDGKITTALKRIVYKMSTVTPFEKKKEIYENIPVLKLI